MKAIEVDDVAILLAYADRDPKEVVAGLPPRWGEATVGKIAVRARMRTGSAGSRIATGASRAPRRTGASSSARMRGAESAARPTTRLESPGASRLFDLPNPPHVQQPLIQQVVNELLGAGKCASTGESALRTTLVMEQLLSRRDSS